MLVYYLCYSAGQKSSTSIKHRQILYQYSLIAWCSILARMPALYILFIERKQHVLLINQAFIPYCIARLCLSTAPNSSFPLAQGSKKQVSSIFVRFILANLSTTQAEYSVCSLSARHYSLRSRAQIHTQPNTHRLQKNTRCNRAEEPPIKLILVTTTPCGSYHKVCCNALPRQKAARCWVQGACYLPTINKWYFSCSEKQAQRLLHSDMRFLGGIQPPTSFLAAEKALKPIRARELQEKDLLPSASAHTHTTLIHPQELHKLSQVSHHEKPIKITRPCKTGDFWVIRKRLFICGGGLRSKRHLQQ